MKKAIAYVLAGVMMFEVAGLTASEQAQASVKGKLNVKSVTLATGKSVTLKVKNKGKPCYGFAGGKETSYCGRRQKECQFHCFK